MKSPDVYETYIPMSESAYYILLSLRKPRHGYGIILHVEDITSGRLRLGPGTIYGTLSRFEKDGLIRAEEEENRRKAYSLTGTGREILEREILRIEELLKNGRNAKGGAG